MALVDDMAAALKVWGEYNEKALEWNEMVWNPDLDDEVVNRCRNAAAELHSLAIDKTNAALQRYEAANSNKQEVGYGNTQESLEILL